MTFLEKLRHLFTADNTPLCGICGFRKAYCSARLEESTSQLGSLRVTLVGRNLYACSECLPQIEEPWHLMERAA